MNFSNPINPLNPSNITSPLHNPKGGPPKGSDISRGCFCLFIIFGLLAIIALLAACEQPDPVPADLSGTEWHWFEFNRGMNNEPRDHWIKFSNRGAEYRMEHGSTSLLLKGQYERIGDKLILTFEDRQDTLTIQKDKLVVKKSAELFEFYVRVR